jgi:DNA-binding MarR family transcriptional regulator
MIEKNAKLLAEIVPQIMGGFHNLSRTHEAANHLTMRQFQALVLLAVNDKMTVSEFNEKLGLAASTGTELLSRMLQEDYISKSEEKADRRQVSLQLAAKGRQALQQRRQMMVTMFVDFLSKLTDAEQMEFVDCFIKIRQLLQRANQPADARS